MRHGLFSGALGAAIFFAAANGALAMMPPWVYEKARADAPYHVQVAIEGVKVPAKTPGNCEVSGEVVRIFRDTPGNLSEGEELSFPIACMRTGDKPLIGGTIWTDVKALVDARYIEVYLVDGEEGLEAAKWQSQIINEPSSAPQFRTQ